MYEKGTCIQNTSFIRRIEGNFFITSSFVGYKNVLKTQWELTSNGVVMSKLIYGYE